MIFSGSGVLGFDADRAPVGCCGGARRGCAAMEPIDMNLGAAGNRNAEADADKCKGGPGGLVVAASRPAAVAPGTATR